MPKIFFDVETDIYEQLLQIKGPEKTWRQLFLDNDCMRSLGLDTVKLRIRGRPPRPKPTGHYSADGKTYIRTGYVKKAHR